MAIEATAVETQMELQIESKEEMYARNFQMDIEIAEKRICLEQANGVVSGIKTEIRILEERKKDLMFKINNGQVTTVAVAVGDETEPESEDVTEDDLKQFDDEKPENTEEGENE